MENLLRGCNVNNIIYLNDLFNCHKAEHIDDRLKDKIIVVDGLQRLTAILAFIDGKFKIFNNQVSYSDILNYEDKAVMRNIFNHATIKLKTIQLTTYSDLLEFYLNYNAGGTVHSDEEIERVKAMLDND